MRICKTPALGTRIIQCNKCNAQHFIYLSCGHSHCPICQAIKREQWIDKLKNQLYKVPYVHATFTLPHEFNTLARKNPGEIYSLLMRSAWMTVKRLAKQPKYIGGIPGMVAVLHTFGSDMKYHIHVHTLITFGGLDPNGKWKYPKHEFKLFPYRVVCDKFKKVFLEQLEILWQKQKISHHLTHQQFVQNLPNKRWVVHHTKPTMDTHTLENYLARYINRTAISNSRIKYIKESQKVCISFNDYKNQQDGKAAPKAQKIIDPLNAIHQFLQHVLPPYFQKSRRYGIHAANTKAKWSIHINQQIKRNPFTIRTTFQILTQLAKSEPFKCLSCKHYDYSIKIIAADRHYLKNYWKANGIRHPPFNMKVNKP